MATVNAYNIDHKTIQPVMRRNKSGGLIPLDFRLITIDFDAVYYEPASYLSIYATGVRERGGVVQPLILQANRALPIATRGQDQDQTGVFQYAGI